MNTKDTELIGFTEVELTEPIESFDYDYKTYVRASTYFYYVSIVTNTMVRQIHANDFKRVKNEYLKTQQQIKDSKKKQLTLDLF